MNIDNETTFEEHIEAALLASPLYISRKPKDFGVKRRVDPICFISSSGLRLTLGHG